MSVKLLLWFFLVGYGGDDITVFGGSQWGCCFVATGGWLACLWGGWGSCFVIRPCGWVPANPWPV